MSVRRVSWMVLPVSVLLGGCAQSSGADPSSVAPELPSTVATPQATRLTTSAVPGATAARDRSFGVLSPAGWLNDTAKQKSTVLYLRAPKPSANVYPCFSVVTKVLPNPPALAELVEQGMIAQRQKGSTVTKLADRSIGGAPASGYTFSRMAQGFAVLQTQYYIINGSQVVVTTMTSAAKDKTLATSTQEAILGSWSWGAPPATAAPSTDTAPSATTTSTTPPPATTP